MSFICPNFEGLHMLFKPWKTLSFRKGGSRWQTRKPLGPQGPVQSRFLSLLNGFWLYSCWMLLDLLMDWDRLGLYAAVTVVLS